MEVIRLLIFLICLVAALSAIYLIFFLALKKKEENENHLDLGKMNRGFKDCGKCGHTCSEYAEKLKNGEMSLLDCPELSGDKKNEIKEMLDLKPYANGDKVAYVFCKGGTRAVEDFNYSGVMKCAYMNKLYNGAKDCKYACLGCMDCAKVCPTQAIFKNANGVAEVDRSMCIGCGECAKVCPDKLIKLISSSDEIVTACKYCISNKQDRGVAKMCSVGCNKCGECVNICPTGALKFTSQKEIKYDSSLCTSCHKCVEVCPQNVINRVLIDIDKI